MNKRFNATAQGGFTLIELIVVIVILGILAATALPKFASLGGDARVASLQAAKGSLASVAAMAHGKSLLNSTPTFDGTTLNMVNTYPKADATTATVAGLGTDYTTVIAGATGTNIPTLVTGQMAIIPSALSGQTQAKNCYLLYTEATSSTSPATVTVPNTATADNCQ